MHALLEAICIFIWGGIHLIVVKSYQESEISAIPSSTPKTATSSKGRDKWKWE